MASAPTHIVAAGAIAAGFHRPGVPWHLWLWGAVLAVAPDFDVIGFRLGIAYGDPLGHRGLSHSLFAAAAVSGLMMVCCYRAGAGILSRGRVWLFFFLAMASHGILDAFTNGGLGIAFFAPFSNARYFFSIRPLEVSPLSITGFFTRDGLSILASELRWVWAPSVALAASVFAYRYWRRSRSAAALPVGR